MNDRLQQLAREAGLPAWATDDARVNVADRLERFAELVIADSEAEKIVRFIANDYCELSADKIAWQRNDWRKRCWNYVRGEE